MGPADAAAALLQVEVAYSPRPRQVLRARLNLPLGATVQQALQAASRHWGLEPEAMVSLGTGVWGRKTEPDVPLRDGDRVEIYRPLLVDPKEARRQRYRRQGEKGRAGRRAVRTGPPAEAPPGTDSA